jgi:glutaredoxin
VLADGRQSQVERPDRSTSWIASWAAAAVAILLSIFFTSRLAMAQARIDIYTRPGCPHCAEAHRFLDDLAKERTDFVVVEHDVMREPQAADRLRSLSEQVGIATPGVPTFVIGGEVLVGFDSSSTPERVRALLEHTTVGERHGAPLRPSQESLDSPELPIFGRVDVGALGLPLFTVAVGLVDGFNPCAMWVLMFLLAMLVNLKSRKKMALIAGTFVLVSGLVYFAFMAAWLTFFMVLGVSQPLRIVLASLALAVGALNVKDFVALGRGPSLGIPGSAKPGFYRRVRDVLHAENLAGAMIGIVVLAFLVNLVELLCTAGLPAIYTAVLTAQGLPTVKHYAYLSLYVFAYMLDDAIMVAIGVATLSRRKLQEKSGRWLKLLSGLVITILGIVLLVRPEWMGF